MGQALYRKYRSKSLSEIVGQEHITETLDKALKSDRISHAYLFTGPRGVGKTSIARILAHEINGLPYSDDNIHMDIIEIDAASNNGVEDIRDLREKAAVAPTSAKYKVYIIDEVHMLSKPAFNALLKTLEEPPTHVVFILATTDAHKLPPTIVSRTQRYTFKPVTQEKVIAHLKHIAATEKISVEDEVLALLAAHGEGSFRDSISMLDQASSQGGALTLSFIQQLLGIPSATGINDLLMALQAQDAPLVAQRLAQLYDQGFQAAAIAKVIGQTIRSELIAGSSSLDGEQALRLSARLLEVIASHDPERLLEIILLSNAGASHVTRKPVDTTQAVPAQGSPVPSKPLPAVAQATAISSKTEASLKPVVNSPVVEEPSKTKPAAPTPEASIFDATVWPNVLAALKQKYNTLYGVVRMAEPTFEGRELELAFGFAFHQKRLTDPKNKKILADIIFDLSGQAVHITCVVRKPDLAKAVAAATPVPAQAPDLSAINDIFGSAEIMK